MEPPSGFDTREIDRAIRNGEEDAFVEHLLRLGLDMNKKDDEGYNALHYAAKYKNERALKLLLDHGFDIKGETKRHSTPLELATERFHKESVKILLEYGARLSNKYTPSMIHAVAVGGSSDDLKKLLALESDKGKICQELLRYAAKGGNKETVDVLLKNGAKVDTISDGRMEDLSIHSAAQGGNIEIVKTFLELGCDINSRGYCGNTTLHYAAKGGHVQMIKFILSQGIEINAKNDRGRSALFSTLHLEQSASTFKSVVRLLLNLGLNINETDNHHNTPLFTFITEDIYWDDLIEILLQFGAHVGTVVNGRTPLHKACGYVNRRVVSLLLKHGANVEARDNRGQTALHEVLLAVYQWEEWEKWEELDRLEIVKELIKYGSNIEAKDSRGRSALSHAVSMFDLIEKHDNFFGRVEGDAGTSKLLLHHGANPNCRDNHNKSVIELAILRGNQASIQLLLDYGLAINDDYGSEKESLIEWALHGDDSEGTNILHAKIITRDMVKRKFRDLPISAKNMEGIANNAELSGFWNQCEQEIERMKTNSAVYNLFLAQTSYQLAVLSKHRKLTRLINSNGHKTEFPIYADHLEEQYRKGHEAKLLLRDVKNFFPAVADSKGNEHLPKLPAVPVVEIFKYFTIKDLETLAYVCNPRRRQLE